MPPHKRICSVAQTNPKEMVAREVFGPAGVAHSLTDLR